MTTKTTATMIQDGSFSEAIKLSDDELKRVLEAKGAYGFMGSVHYHREKITAGLEHLLPIWFTSLEGKRMLLGQSDPFVRDEVYLDAEKHCEELARIDIHIPVAVMVMVIEVLESMIRTSNKSTIKDVSAFLVPGYKGSTRLLRTVIVAIHEGTGRLPAKYDY